MARDTSFYYSFLVLPPEKRSALVAVWDFCRAVDDAVDERTGEEAIREVARWRSEVEACYSGHPATPQGVALAPLIGRFHLPRESFEALIEGVEMDLGSRRYETFPDLYEYCIRVASAVGLICLPVFGTRDPRSRQYAIDLGVALQLTNILRDVSGDLARGRVYIPEADLRRHGCTDRDLADAAAQRGGVPQPAVRNVLRDFGGRAREYYAKAAAALPRVDARRLAAAEIMAAIYKAILRRIERRNYDVFSEVVRVPRPRRALIAATTWARVALRP